MIGMSRDDRGQAFTLEGVAAALLVLIAVLYTLQGIVVTPTTPGTLDRQTRAELSTQAGDLLSAAHENGSLVDAALDWNDSAATFHSDDHEVTAELGHGQEDPDSALGRMLNQTFAQRGLTYNVYVRYRNGEDTTETERVVYIKRGVPTDNAVMARFSVALYDDMRLTSSTTNDPLVALNESRFYARDIDSHGPLYNVVEIQVVVW